MSHTCNNSVCSFVNILLVYNLYLITNIIHNDCYDIFLEHKLMLKLIRIYLSSLLLLPVICDIIYILLICMYLHEALFQKIFVPFEIFLLNSLNDLII